MFTNNDSILLLFCNFVKAPCFEIICSYFCDFACFLPFYWCQLAILAWKWLFTRGTMENFRKIKELKKKLKITKNQPKSSIFSRFLSKSTWFWLKFKKNMLKLIKKSSKIKAFPRYFLRAKHDVHFCLNFSAQDTFLLCFNWHMPI